MFVVNALKGYKTYIVSALAVVTGVIAYLHGTESLSTALTNAPGLLVFVGALASTLRAGVKKVELLISELISKLPKSVQAKVQPEVTKVEAEVNKVASK